MKKTSSKTKNKSYRDDILKYALKTYATIPDYPWMSLPGYAVLRHKDNKKWYGIIMDVPKDKLGLSGKKTVDVLEIKCDPVMIGSLLTKRGFLPAYHMNRGNWITILLDTSVDKEMIFSLLEISYELTASRQTKQKMKVHKKRDWIIPANPKYYDLEKAFSENETILWKQSSHVCVGDLVYLYIASPVSAIRYKCQAVEVDIPYQYDDGKVHMNHVMKLKCLEQYEQSLLTLDKLKEHGVYAVRGPRNMPDSLLHEIEAIQHE